jgi:hypothetical protein
LIVFKNCEPRFVRRAGDANLFCHRTFPSSGIRLLGLRQGRRKTRELGREGSVREG